MGDTTRKNPHYVQAVRDLAETEWLDVRGARRGKSPRQIAEAKRRRFAATVMKEVFDEAFDQRWSGWPVYVGRRIIAAIARGDYNYFADLGEYVRRTSTTQMIPASRVDRVKVEILAFLLQKTSILEGKAPVPVRFVCEFLKTKGYTVGGHQGGYAGDVSRKQIQGWLKEWDQRGWLTHDTRRGSPKRRG